MKTSLVVTELKRPETPADAWAAMQAGNRRFVTGAPAHPRQDIDRRSDLATGQKPFAALFGCADSRLSAEIIFDVGLGDLFVVRNAGQVIAETILGSLEYSVEVLGVPLILILGHDECGAIRATMDSSLGLLKTNGEFIQNLVDRIQPTVTAANQAGKFEIDDVTELHIQDTINELLTRSRLISDAVKAGKLAVVGANYRLALGEIHPILEVGNV
ncbi:carbonic anhydrase [Candidatus Rhodoluna planktonica]|uniref:carbonic anhydrase n=1 Tax=Candidatus Rhodoluna planktonica TaxID=535712 RepID=A0A1D9DYA4_9MICO|nr:carbonic anhydrase [Candidatus Rhodoluna planktonica]